MAEQKQHLQQHRSSKFWANRAGGNDDPRHAPESGEPMETGPKSQKSADARDARDQRATGDRDESGRLGSA